MPLILQSELNSLLVCPSCKGQLVDNGCVSCSRGYAPLGRWPALIDFERSVVTREDLVRDVRRSAVPRRPPSAFIGRMRRCVKVTNQVASKKMDLLLQLVGPGSRVLVVGGGTLGAGMTRLYSNDTDVDIVAFDIYGSEHVQLIADAHQLPFESGLFDAVVIQAVLEHVLDPSIVVREIWRVLRPNGYLYAETPFLQHVHEGAYDFTRFTDSGHRWLFKDFDVLESGPIGGPAAQMLWSVHHLVWGLTRSRTLGLIVRSVLRPIQLLDRFVSRAHRLDAATGVYLLGKRADNPVAPADVIQYYSGSQ